MASFLISAFKPTDRSLVDSKMFSVNDAEYTSVEYGLFGEGKDSPYLRAAYALKLARDTGIILYTGNVLKTTASTGQLVVDENFVGCCCKPCLSCEDGNPTPTGCDDSTLETGLVVRYAVRDDALTLLTNAGFHSLTSYNVGDPEFYLPYSKSHAGTVVETGYITLENAEANNFLSFLHGLTLLAPDPHLNQNYVNGIMAILQDMVIKAQGLDIVLPELPAQLGADFHRSFYPLGLDIVNSGITGGVEQNYFEYIYSQFTLTTAQIGMEYTFSSFQDVTISFHSDFEITHEWQAAPSEGGPPIGLNILDLLTTTTGENARLDFETNKVFQSCNIYRYVNSGV